MKNPLRKIKYVTTRLLRLDYGRAARAVADTAKQAGKSRLLVFLDMIWCGLRYSAGPNDYALFSFYSLNSRQRATYVTRGINNALVKKYNDPARGRIFADKTRFNAVFSDYMGRDWLALEGADEAGLAAFLEGKGELISKPLDATCGKGIEKLRKADFESAAELLAYLRKNGAGLVEEVIIQHRDMASIYPGSVNTARLVTILDKGEAEVVFAFIRIGNGRVVDNLNSGGMAAPIDIATGTITHPAADKDGIVYTEHPATGTRIVGFTVPFWRESVDMVLRAAKVVPEVGYVGWDVAVTPTGPVLIEGNNYPGHDILQLPAHVPDRVGLKPRVEKYL